MKLTDKEREEINRKLFIAQHRKSEALQEADDQQKVIDSLTEQLRRETEPVLPIEPALETI